MLKAVKIRIYPNKEQATYINKLLGCYRFVYNKCLDKKKTAYLTNKSNLGLKDLGNYFHQELTKTEEFNFLNEHNTKVLKQSVLNMLDSYKNFFINGSGFPKFKSKHDNKQSCRFPEEAISSKNDYQTGKLTLTTQLKNLKFKCSDGYKNYWTYDTCKEEALKYRYREDLRHNAPGAYNVIYKNKWVNQLLSKI